MLDADHSPTGYSPEEIDKYNIIVTAHAKDDDTLIISLFPVDQWDMITSTALSLDMAVEDIIRGLGPDEVTQHEINADDWNDFFIEAGLLDDDIYIEDDDGDIEDF